MVLLYGEVIGRIDQATPNSPPELHYEDDHVERASVPLGLRLPLSNEVSSGKPLDAYLAGLLPEDLDTRRRLATDLGVGVDDAVGILARMGWDCPGAVQFCTPEDLDEMASRPGDHVAVSDADIESRLRSLRTEDGPSWTMPDERWSLAGQQAKIALAKLDGAWHEAHGSAATTHIVKPGVGHLTHQGLVEHATMRAAAAVGVDVAETEFRHFGDEAAVVITRFDRLVRRDGGVLRIHQEDLCSATGRSPERKYESDGGPGVRDMALVIERHVADRATAMRSLADFVAINYIAGAPDGHAKNIAVLILPGEVRMAPLYDLATGLTYDRRQILRQVAVSISGQRALGSVVGRHWDKVARLLAIPPEEYRARLSHIADGYTDAFSDALADVGTPEAQVVRARTVDRLAAHIAGVARRLDDPIT